MAVEMSREEFEELVGEALDLVPDELAGMIANVVVLVEDEPPEGEPLFGLYVGVPLTERGFGYGGVLPDRITIFRGPHLRACESIDELVDQIHITVVHEIAHYFGIEDEALDELGY